MGAVVWILAVLMLELAVGLVLLGTWVAEGRRRAEELERIEGLLRRAGAAVGASGGSERQATDRA